MNILLEDRGIYETGTLTLELREEIKLNISAEEARRLANRFVHLEVSSQMRAEKPLLVVGQQVNWRVPIHLTFPSFGDVGCVGYLHVDPVTGEIDSSPAVLQAITDHAENLAARFTSPATRRG